MPVSVRICICAHSYVYICPFTYIHVYNSDNIEIFSIYSLQMCLSLDAHFCWRLKLGERWEGERNDLSVRDLSFVFLFVLLNLEMLHRKILPTFHHDVKTSCLIFQHVYHASFFISVLSYLSFQSWQFYPILTVGEKREQVSDLRIPHGGRLILAVEL